MSMHFAPQWLKQPIKPSAQAQTKLPPAPIATGGFPPLAQGPGSARSSSPSPYTNLSYSHITQPTSPAASSVPEPVAGDGAHPFRYSRQDILGLFDAQRFAAPPIELAHLASSEGAVIYSEQIVSPIGLRELNEVEKRLLGSSVNPRLLRTAGGAGGKGPMPGGMMSPGSAGAGIGIGAIGGAANGVQAGQGPQGGHKRVPGSIGEKIEPPVRSSATNWRPSRTLSSSGALPSPGAGFDGVLGFGSLAPAPPTPTANGHHGLQAESDAGPGWGSGNRRWRSAAAIAQERSSQSTIATPSATPVPERDATVATPAPAPAQPRTDTPSSDQQPSKADLAAVKWFYLDPSGNQQGPFGSTEMHDWYSLSYFVEELPLRRDSETEYQTLRDLKIATGSATAPFLTAVLPKAPPPMLPPNLPIPGFNMPPQPQPWGAFPQPQQNLVAPFENLSIQHPFAPYPQHIPPQPIYSPVIGGPVQRTNGYYSPAVGVPLADVHSPWGVQAQQQVQQQQQQQQQPQQQQHWQSPAPQPQPSYFPQAQAPAPFVEQPREIRSAAPEPVREPSPEKVPEALPEPVEPAPAKATPIERSPVPTPAAPATPAAVPAPSPWAKVEPAPAPAETETAAESPAITAPTPAQSTTLPPAHASLPAKPAARQSVSVSAVATAESSPVTTPAKAKAPWAAAKEEDKGRASPVGPSLREIQEAEAKEASSRKAAERAAAPSPAPATVGSPQQMSWGLPGQSKAAPSPAPTPSGPVWGGDAAAPPKKTLKQIQEEEEKRKAKVAAQAKVAAAANGNSSSAKRGYADLAAAPSAPAASAGGAWSTVGAGGKASGAPAKPVVAAPAAKPVVVSVRPPAVKKPVVDEQPSVEFIRWTKQALVGLSGVNVDEFIQMLLLFPIEPGAQRAETLEIIADSVYANSSTLDGRRFAQEFYTKRKADAQARTSAKISSLADVVKTQPKPAPTSDFGFKVVKAKGKGRK